MSNTCKEERNSWMRPNPCNKRDWKQSSMKDISTLYKPGPEVGAELNPTTSTTSNMTRFYFTLVALVLFLTCVSSAPVSVRSSIPTRLNDEQKSVKTFYGKGSPGRGGDDDDDDDDEGGKFGGDDDCDDDDDGCKGRPGRPVPRPRPVPRTRPAPRTGPTRPAPRPKPVGKPPKRPFPPGPAPGGRRRRRRRGGKGSDSDSSDDSGSSDGGKGDSSDSDGSRGGRGGRGGRSDGSDSDSGDDRPKKH